MSPQAVATAPEGSLANPRRQRVSSVEFWRFAFTVFVCIYHFGISFSFSTKLFGSGSGAVEFFFILAGFTMAMGAHHRLHDRVEPVSAKEAGSQALLFVKKKLKAIYPLLALMLILAFVVFPTIWPSTSIDNSAAQPWKPVASPFGAYGGYGGTGTGTTGGFDWSAWGGTGTGTTTGTGATAGFDWNAFGATTTAAKPSVWSHIKSLQNTEWELLFMVGTPLGYSSNFAYYANNDMTPFVPLWYLTELLLVGYLYTYAIYKKYDFMKFFAPALGVLAYIFFTMNSNMLVDFEKSMLFFNAGTIHAIAEMSFGVSTFFLYEYLSKKKFGNVAKILFTLLEIYAIYRFFRLSLWQDTGMNNFRKIPYMMIIIMLSFLNVGWISKLLNHRISRWLGSITLAMYLIHYPLVKVYLQISHANTMAQMTAKDIILYLLLVIGVSIAMMLYIEIFKRGIVQPISELRKRKQEEKLLYSND
jgi:peptidoglycan/LPS O-acetylase OafA/YrhL